MTMRLSRTYLVTVFAALLLLAGCGDPAAPSPDTVSDTPVGLYPDYADVTFPVNIAAPSFEPVAEGADKAHMLVGIEGSEPEISVEGRGLALAAPLDRWHSLLGRAAGKRIYFRILTRRDGRWTQHPDVMASVSADSIDSHLVFRMLYPGYELWQRVGIYQRDLESYTQLPILENKDMDNNCLNCHSFAANDPSTLQIHLRGKHKGTLISRNGKITKVTPAHDSLPGGATYPTWNRDGRWIAYSANNVGQAFHQFGPKAIEVVDIAADLMMYDTETGRSFTSPVVSGDKYYETFPAWHPGSDDIYFCRALARRPDQDYNETAYDLCRVKFDRSTGEFGDSVEVVYPAASMGRSVSFPRVSPDGRYLMFTRADYGTFSIWHPEADLMLLDLSDGSVRPLDEVNAPDDVDSYHSWSSDGRWFVFSSKRLDGLTARPYIASFDPATGRATKPFVMPQPDPRYYDDQSLTYNVPELVKGAVTISDRLLEAALKD